MRLVSLQVGAEAGSCPDDGLIILNSAEALLMKNKLMAIALI